MLEVYLEELSRACEDIQESKDYPDNYHASIMRSEKYKYIKEIMDKIDAWLEENVPEEEKK